MSKIQNIIPERNFEIVRSKIVDILTDEFAEQFSLTSNPLFQATVFKERFIAFDKTELPAVLVYFSRDDFDSKITTQSKGDAVFGIEVHTKAKFTNSERGDTQASLDCDKLCGVIQYILDSPYYIRLDLSPGIVQSSIVDSIQIGKSDVADGISTVVGLISLRVRILEDNGALTSSSFEGSDTIMNDELHLTVNK